MSTRILIADDHGIVRGGLRLLLERQPDMEVVGEAADGAEAHGMLGQIPVPGIEPHVGARAHGHGDRVHQGHPGR